MINTINSFNSPVKQTDKLSLEIRISKLTILEIKADWSNKSFRFIIFNLGFERVPC
jgi:hypothetical protein